ncbi:hypothetical protein TPHA_0N00840 [Tetrapisispora phaffii CBS 4417]|uniref:Protein CMS1 n=1 Tax=Tetrapisispora phaffii (strain ATCC 24235 / CBS 4417 / NBRC 1672 / NRRL Y-8282 / UCD 70-5) TaxID=1071381 RepID=G8C137_TETPH|nr:hypothetical protein TPHA_0N00840 [Tetrapisispora phaffii CBS 4417]CCE65865.1 hypothetical protein TPHA_0N00840 [Tetrapisispora phaffii CBS 4417]
MSNADDLDDGLVYDLESDSNDAQQVDNLLNDVDGASDVEEATEVSTKRKVEEDDITEIAKDTEEIPSNDEEHLSRRQKKLKNSKLHQKRKEEQAYEVNFKKQLPKSDTSGIADYFTKIIREKNPDLSALELEELYINKSNFITTEKFENDRDLANFPDFMAQFSKSPKAIIFSMSNMRVADVSRSLNSDNNCIKLFAKNKLKEDVQTVNEVFEGKNKRFKNTKYFIATPTRMDKLLETTDLFFQGKDKLDIILDASYLDAKNNSLLSSENSALLIKVLKTILDKKSSVKILLY